MAETTHSKDPRLNAALEKFMANVTGDRPADPANERDRPKSAPIPTGQQRVLADSGGQLLGVRMATAVLAATDPRLRPSTSRWFLGFLWNYHPGRIYRKSAKRIGLTLGLAERTWKQAVGQLKRHGYLQRCQGGWISPPVELKLPAEKRAWTEQLSFDFVAEWDTLGSAKYLQLVEREPVDKSDSSGGEKVHTRAPQRAHTCTSRCTHVHVHPRLTPDLPLTDPAHRAECGPSKDGGGRFVSGDRRSRRAHRWCGQHPKSWLEGDAS